MTNVTPQQALLKKVIHFSTFEQPCDVLLKGEKPHLDVKVSPKYGSALMAGAGASKMVELFATLELQDGSAIPFAKVWDILPMPKGGISADELAAVDLTEGEAVGGPNGETVRQMITQMYNCQTAAETEFALRRFLAS